MTFRALTVRQPFAADLVLGRKRFEFRSWSFRVPGLVAIHAASFHDKAAWNAPGAAEQRHVLHDLRSTFVGVVELLGWIPAAEAGVRVPVLRGGSRPLCFAWRIGRAWPILNAPVRIRGQLGLWTVEGLVEDELRAVLPREVIEVEGWWSDATREGRPPIF